VEFDLTKIPGIKEQAAQIIISEVGHYSSRPAERFHQNQNKVLNVAAPREGNEPGILPIHAENAPAVLGRNCIKYSSPPRSISD
jgi:hypothetical protein